MASAAQDYISLAQASLSAVLAVAGYILGSLGCCAIAKRRGIRHPWLAWIPLVNGWLIGCISDQYQHIVKGRNRSRRKSLLVLGIIRTILACAAIILAICALDYWLDARQASLDYHMGGIGPEPDFGAWPLICMLLGAAVLALPAAGVAIAAAVVRYIALYDLYRSCNPNTGAVFLVLSIVFGITEPFFIFFSRKKDAGMQYGLSASPPSI